LKKSINILLATVLIFSIIMIVIINIYNSHSECSAQVGGVKGTVRIRDRMENFIPFAWATITITSLDGPFSVNTSSNNAGTYWATGLPNGDYNVSVWAPHPTKTDWYWFDSKLVSVNNGDSLADFYLDDDEHLVPEFSDYAITALLMISLLSSLIMIKRMKNRVGIPDKGLDYIIQG
jgi:hypothetical protein